jgi:hypothetical protein
MLNQIIFIITASFLNIISMINLSFFSALLGHLFQFIYLLFNTNFLIYFVLFLFIIIFLGSRAGKIGKIIRDAAVTLGGSAAAYDVYSNSGGGSSRRNNEEEEARKAEADARKAEADARKAEADARRAEAEARELAAQKSDK